MVYIKKGGLDLGLGSNYKESRLLSLAQKVYYSVLVREETAEPVEPQIKKE